MGYTGGECATRNKPPIEAGRRVPLRIHVANVAREEGPRGELLTIKNCATIRLSSPICALYLLGVMGADGMHLLELLCNKEGLGLVISDEFRESLMCDTLSSESILTGWIKRLFASTDSSQ
jgi:hypothetical protein